MALKQIKQRPGLLLNQDTGKFVKITDVSIGEKYDTIAIGNATALTGTVNNFFQNINNKPLVDANILTPRRLSSGEIMWVTKVGFYFPQAHGNTLLDYEDMFKYADAGYFILRLSTNKDVLQGPVSFFPIGYGFYGQTTRNNTGIVSMGVPAPSGIPPLAKKLFINDQIDINASVTFAPRAPWDGPYVAPVTSANRFAVKCVLHGRLITPATL